VDTLASSDVELGVARLRPFRNLPPASASIKAAWPEGGAGVRPWTAMNRALMLLAAVAVVAVVVVGLTQAGGSDVPGQEGASFDLATAKQDLDGAPAPLAGLHAQANELLEGGTDAFGARLRELRGHPVVINKWASWCGPCRAEFPIFQQLATTRGKEIAFVGVNARDKRPAAERFSANYPVPYPSYEDPAEQIARMLKAPSNFPVTLFVDARGRTVFTHQGGYRSAADLSADIDEHLGS
jgi:cytochrome c biogenesis protein CcmG, thiol:disulfide interchange protein DsbE